MNHLLRFLFFLGSPFMLAAQNLDHLMVERAPDCNDIRYNAIKLLKKYHAAGQTDSMVMMINYWKSKCEFSEELFRFSTLLDIKKGQFFLHPNDFDAIDYLVEYAQRQEVNANTAAYNQAFPFRRRDFAHQKEDYLGDSLSQQIANELLPSQSDNRAEHLFCLFYANRIPSIFDSIHLTKFINLVPLQQTYNQLLTHYDQMTDMHYSIFSGVWIPQGNLSRLGLHPSIGFSIGFKKKRFTYDFAFDFRFLESANTYQVKYEGKVIDTKQHFSLYMGINTRYDIIRKNRHRIYVGTGLGIDMMSVIDSDMGYDNSGRTLVSPHIYAGLGYRYSLLNRSYVALQSQYGLLFYTNNGGSSLSGNSIGITLIYGGFDNYTKETALKNLRKFSYD